MTYAGGLGLPIVIARFASVEASEIAAWAMRVRVGSAVVVSLIFVALFGRTASLQPLGSLGWVTGVTVFVAVAIGMGLAVLVEVRLMTLRLWKWVVLRSFAVMVARLPLLGLLTGDLIPDEHVSFALFAVASVPVAVSGYLLLAYLIREHDSFSGLSRSWPSDGRRILRFSLLNWMSLSATEGPVLAVPLVVALSVDGAENSPFYVAWAIGAILFLVPHVVGQVTLSEASESGRAEKLALGLKIALAVTALAAIGSFLGAGVLEWILGEGYESLSDYLPILAAAAVPWSVTSLSLTASRLDDRDAVLITLSLLFVLCTLVPAVLVIGDRGVEAVAWCWLAGNTLTAAIAVLIHMRRSFAVSTV